MTSVHVVVPTGLDDVARVSGGNRYDRRVCDGLREAGWTVAEIAAAGSWPEPDAGALEGLARSLDAVPNGALVLLDGLIASAAAPVLVTRSERLRLVVLVHMAFGGTTVAERDELAVLASARAVITTSTWARGHLLDRYPLVPARVHVAPPGTDPTPAGTPSADGRRLLCVGTLAPHKGQDLLMEALARMAGLSWSCTLIGRLDSDLPFVASLQSRAAAARISDRLRVLAPRTGRALQAEFRGADVLVVPSRAETFGMVVSEALAAGLPVISTTAGGLPEALGTTVCGLPGLLVPSNDHQALAAALTRWLTDERLRSSLRQAASCRRRTLPDWRTTRDRVAAVLASVRDEPDQPPCRGEL